MRTILKLKLIFLFSVTFPFSMAAGEDEQRRAFELSLEELLQVTVASRDIKSVATAPSNVTVFTRSDIDGLGLNSLQELLNLVPGFQSTRDVEQGTSERLAIRGKSTALSESILVLIDGQRLNDLYSGGISILNRQLTLANVKQVEIIRGPGSALYGSNAFMGIINIITESKNNYAEISFGDISSHSLDWQLSGQNENALQWSVFGSFFKQQGEEYYVSDQFGQTGTTRDPISGTDLYAKLHWKNWQLNARLMQRELEQFMVFGNLNNDVNNEQTQQWSLALEHHYPIKLNSELRSRLSFSRDLWDTRALLLPSGTLIDDNVTLQQDFLGGPFLKTQSINFSLEDHITVDQQQSWLLGFSSEFAEVIDVANVTTHNPVTLEYFDEFRYLREQGNFNSKSSRDIFSVYVQHQIQLDETWHLTSGIRYDHYNDFGSATSPRVALIWRYLPATHFKFMYASAFRAPNFLELYDKNNPVDSGNPHLVAEEVNTAEISWISQFTHWRIELGVFNNQFHNPIMLGPPIAGENNPLLAPTFFNGKQNNTLGFESTINYHITNTASFTFNWSSFFRSKSVDTPDDLYSLHAQYHWSWLTAGLTAYYNSDNKLNAEQGGYSIWNTHWRLPVNDNTELSFSVKNITDKQYFTPSYIMMDGVANRGREFLFNIRYDIN